MVDGPLLIPTDEASPDGPSGPDIRVLLVDDHLAFRQPLAFLLEREPDITVVGQAGSVAEARPLLPEADLALIDLKLPDGEGVALLQELRAVNPQAIALVLTGNHTTAAMARAVEAGAAGVLHKSRPVRDIVDAIRRVQAGESLVSLHEAIELLQFLNRQREQDRAVQVIVDRLTPREREVLQALAEGLSDRAIAQRLYIRPETVRTHMVNVLAKLDVDSRLQALVFALKHGLVSIEGTGGGHGRVTSDAGARGVPRPAGAPLSPGAGPPRRARAHGARVVTVPTPARPSVTTGEGA
jgi:DNA-binding NarL/FixJ family response regulator